MFASASQGRRSLGVIAVFGLTFGYLLARCFIGVDFVDGSYVLALSRRMAAGDLPFVDEMSAHTLGSLPAVPFVWLWTTLFDTTGLIAASRVFAVAWIAVVAVFSYRALAHSLPPFASAIAVCATCVALPYSLIATSYNTVPMFGLLLAACAAQRTIIEYHRGWAVTAALAATAATLGFPAVAPGAAILLLLLVFACRARGVAWRRLAVDVGATWLAATVIVLGVVSAVIGVTAVRQTVDLQSALRPGLGPIVLKGLVDHQLSYLKTPGMIPLAFVLAVVSCVVAQRKWLSLAAAGVSGALLLAFAAQHPTPNLTYIDDGSFAGAFALIAAMVWAPFAVRIAITNTAYRWLLWCALGVLPAAAGVQLVTASGYTYGAAVDGSTPLICATALGFALHVRSVTPGFSGAANLGTAAVATMPLLAILVCLNSIVFTEGPVLQSRHRIGHGPAAGIWASSSSMTSLQAMQRLTAACPTGGKALSIQPGAYLWMPARSAALMSWVGKDFLHVLPIEEQRARRPDCVIVEPESSFPAGSAADAAARRQLLVGMRPATPLIVLDRDPVHQDVGQFQTWVRTGE